MDDESPAFAAETDPLGTDLAPSTCRGSSIASAQGLEEYMESRKVLEHHATAVIVDGFRHSAAYLSQRRQDQRSANGESSFEPFACIYFLSHFHSDHYIGLHSGWAHGPIFASRVTAALLPQLGVEPSRVVALDVNSTYIVSLTARTVVRDCGPTFPPTFDGPPDELEVTLVSANHCPGACMFVFRHIAHGTVVHTGDFRYNDTRANFESRIPLAQQRLALKEAEFMGDHPVLRCIAGHVNLLFLDNTFCDPAYSFEPQEAAYEAAVGAVRSAFQNAYQKKYEECAVTVTAGDAFVDHRGHSDAADAKRCSCCDAARRCVHVAALIGTYTIGKERIAIATARAMAGQQEQLPGGSSSTVVPIHVSLSKKQLLDATELEASQFVVATTAAVPVTNSHTTNSDIDEPAQPLRHVETKITQIALPESDVDCFLSIFLVPLHAISYRALQEGVISNSILLWDNTALPVEGMDRVVCIEPTGWSAKRAHGSAAQPKRVGTKIERWSIPYSEHCSYRELIRFVAFLKPRRIVPTVSKAQFKEHEPSFVAHCDRLAPTYSKMQPLTKWFHKVARHAADLATSATSAISKLGASPKQDEVPAEWPVRTKRERDETPLTQQRNRHRSQTCDVDDDDIVLVFHKPSVITVDD